MAVERRSTDVELEVLRQEVSRLRYENNRLSAENSGLMEAHYISQGELARAQRRLAELAATLDKLVNKKG